MLPIIQASRNNSNHYKKDEIKCQIHFKTNSDNTKSETKSCKNILKNSIIRLIGNHYIYVYKYRIP